MTKNPNLEIHTPEEILAMRKPELYHAARVMTTAYLHAKYGGLEVHGEHHLANGGIIAANHQLYDDIPVEAAAMWKAKHMTRWPMKSTLPKIFQDLGGIFFTREKDLEGLEPEKKRAATRARRKQTINGFSAIGQANKQGEYTILHPSKERRENYLSDNGLLDNIARLVGTQYEVIALNIIYPRKKGEPIHANFYEPITLPATSRAEQTKILDHYLLEWLS